MLINPITKSSSQLHRSPSFKAIGSSALFIFNAALIILGIVFIVIPDMPLLHYFLGIILLLTWTGNILLVFFNEQSVDKSVKRGGWTDIWGTIYLIVTIFAMGGMFTGSFLISSSYSETFQDNIVLYLLLYFSFFSTPVTGMIVAFLSRTVPKQRISAKPTSNIRNNTFPIIGKVILYLFLFTGIYLAFNLFSKSENRGPAELIVSQFALFLAFAKISATVLLLKLHRDQKGSHFYYIVTTAGLTLFLIFIIPLLYMPSAALNAEKDFTNAFGSNWPDRIDPEVHSHFLENRFLLPAYFLGMRSGDYSVKKDVLFYEGKDGVDNGMTLYFDAYMPPNEIRDLPGNNSAIIRIHGGGWVSGGKGLRNMMQVNKYFAAQGYTVFDVQYGLSTLLGEGPGILGAPDHLVGPFELDDMVRHLGIFTHYLEENADEFNIDLSSVFISGGSAGGHLSTAVGLAISSGKYPEIFSSNLTVRGLIPFYPGNKYSLLPDIGGADEWLDVELLIDENSPPCLIFQGSHDGLVPPWVSYSFQEKYADAGINECAVLMMPFGGHACDLGFTGYYNQLFIYYMERFLALYK